MTESTRSRVGFPLQFKGEVKGGPLGTLYLLEAVNA